MSFEPSPEIQELLDRVDAFVDAELLPLEPAFLAGPFRELLPQIEALRQRVRELGLWAAGQPQEYGGLGLGLVDYALFSERLGRSPLGHFTFGCQAPDAGNAEILHLHGSPEQRERWLKPLVAGQLRSCFSMTEVDMPGSNPVMLETTAVLDAGEWVINGRKWYTSSAEGAAVAVVMAITDPEAPTHRRASMILVPTDSPGFETVRNIPVMGHAGDDFFSHAEIVYRDCRVPAANLLGGRGDGFVIAQERLGPGRIHHCMRWLGICQRSFELLCSHALARRIAPDRTLAESDVVRTWIAECAAEIRAARLATLDTAWRIARDGWKAAREEISMIKFQVAGTMLRVVDRALQAHGGLGMTDDTVLAFFYRHERAARIYDGPDEVHKLAVAKRILRRHARGN